VTATASHLLSGETSSSVTHHYQNALGDIHRELRRPLIQRSLYSFAQTTNPREIYRSTWNKAEVQHRALAQVPEDLLKNIPESNNAYSLFQGFQATLPEESSKLIKWHHKRRLKNKDGELIEETGPTAVMVDLKNQKKSLSHRLEMLGVRKSMCSSEIHEIDAKISNLNNMRRTVLDRLTDLEQEEFALEEQAAGVENKIDDLQEEIEDDAVLAGTTVASSETKESVQESEPQERSEGFMTQSIYEKLPSPRSTKPRRRPNKRASSSAILHEHLKPGSKLGEILAHGGEQITALDFDVPFGTMVTAAMDDTVRVWDLNAGRCMGLLEGHISSVRCLQVEDDIVATGSTDASIRLWDLSKAQYAPKTSNRINKSTHDNDTADESDPDSGLDFQNDGDQLPPPPSTSMQDCPLYSLEAHVAEVTALHFRGTTLVSGSSDKTLRQWDLEKGRCVQTLDVLWAAAQASTSSSLPGTTTQSTSNPTAAWRRPGVRLSRDDGADFVGALQVFDAALACGTADGTVRLWDLRSGQVHRSLVGHTGPVTALQFDDVHLVTSSMDRSIRVSLLCDLQTLLTATDLGFTNRINP
jgi:division protein 1